MSNGVSTLEEFAAVVVTLAESINNKTYPQGINEDFHNSVLEYIAAEHESGDKSPSIKGMIEKSYGRILAELADEHYEDLKAEISMEILTTMKQELKEEIKEEILREVNQATTQKNSLSYIVNQF